MNWPKPGDKIKTKKVFPSYFYPHFNCMVKDGYENLKPETEYTVRKCEVYSSWCAVWLEEFLDNEVRDERYFNLTFFTWNYGK
jgi:hypothetical protein